MNKRRQPFTLEEHRALGAELKAMRDRMVRITVQLSNRYTVKIGTKAHKALDAIDALRSEMDTLVIREQSGATDERLDRIYYPGGSMPEPTSEG